MKFSRYFVEQVLLKRPYIRLEWLGRGVLPELTVERQPDGRIKVWVYIESEDKFLRIVYLEDGKTVHNAFFDRGYKGSKHET
ncbi:MAG: hypothetical protein H3C47_15485 [Candidatus Cloacimonetes bacterium]|nr:hypothetical protein [Candidatus Cloacimonadota bacterium]